MQSGCALFQADKTVTANAQSRQQQRNYHEVIQLSGRLHVLYEQDEKQQSITGSYEWQQDSENIRINLLSSLGQTIAKITVTSQGASLEQANRPVRFARNIDSLLEDNLGWSMPIANLRDWLQGQIKNAQGQRNAIPAQDGVTTNANDWQIRFMSWQEAKPILPRRIDLERSTTAAGQVSLRLLIDEWQIPE
jgi:outer membrane lipoprotein LolB